MIQNFKAGDTEIVILGFSRGAALARAFANRICQRGDPLGEGNIAYNGRKAPIGVCQSSGSPPRVKFVGLYDTVGSFGVPGNKTDIGKDLYLSPECAAIVRQAAAEHERRDNFELTSIYPREGYVDRTGRMIERTFPGAHSDVGGGYTDNYLAREPLDWMYREAMRADVRFDEDLMRTYFRTMQKSPNGTGIHNSDIWFYWRRTHPIMTPRQVRKVEQTQREIFYYDDFKKRLRI